jgi:hypothetical protein
MLSVISFEKYTAIALEGAMILDIDVENLPRGPYDVIMDLFPNEQNFDLDKSRQTFHPSLKEHHKISNIPKFLCEML